MEQVVKIGTRASQLALWQAEFVSSLIHRASPELRPQIVKFTTKGDRILDRSLPAIGGKGLFTEELEQALLGGDIDCAVHSLKDLPTENPPGLTVGAIPRRAPVEDVVVSKHAVKLFDLPEGAAIGTSSLRRAAQLRRYRRDFAIIDIRGNVPTRIEKAMDPDGPYDAIILARAGVERLGLTEFITEILDVGTMLPAPGQGAIGIQCRDGDLRFTDLNDLETRLAVTAERAFLNTLQGGCSVPVAAHGLMENGSLVFSGIVIAVDGQERIVVDSRVELGGGFVQAFEIGRDAALLAIERGADKILGEVRHDIRG